ncbi:MAG: YihA family ribosome biogenesis GTP-binding protein [candidate division Zixibacteria bacterium]|nr:YihA family ribosome biogenesis GTP-binding protein [candidate division Zixibacteria bacterium]
MPPTIKKVEFIGSFPDYSNAKIPHFPQIAFAGRSNVGKSSLINRLVGRKSIAKVSSTPGKTRLLNFFLINDRYLFVDLPGYGYAKASKRERNRWKPMVEAFLSGSDQLRGLIILVDGRRGIQPEEFELIEYAEHCQVTPAVVFTKADKLNQSQRAKIRNQYSNCLFFSSVTGEGKKELLNYVFELL